MRFLSSGLKGCTGITIFMIPSGKRRVPATRLLQIPEESRCHHTYGKQIALVMKEAPGDATAMLAVASKTKKATVGRGGSI